MQGRSNTSRDQIIFKTEKEGILLNSFYEANITIYENLTKTLQDN